MKQDPSAIRKHTPEEISKIRSALYSNLWGIADELRGRMDSSNFKNYMLSIIFYKNLSERLEETADRLLESDGLTYAEAWENESYREAIQDELIKDLGYLIEPDYLFDNLVNNIRLGALGRWHIDQLSTAFSKLTESTIGQDSQDDFSGLFSSIDLNSPSLGKTMSERNDLMGRIILRIAAIDFHSNDVEIDLLGDAYEYLIGKFASDAGKSGGEFYTPQEVATLIAKIVSAKKPDLNSVYDPTCGSGSLLFRVVREISRNDKERLKKVILEGQELNIETYNMARMNLILHGVPWQNFSIQNGNTLEEDLHAGKTYDAIVANPPYSTKWNPKAESVSKDPRFTPAGAVAPAGKADLAFVQHIVSHMKDDGIAVIVLPIGILYRGSSEAKIRQWLIDENLVDAVISLPGGIFNAGVLTLILILRKGREEDAGIRYIDSSEGFIKTKQLNVITEDAIARSIQAYTGNEGSGIDEDHYSRLVSLNEVKENDYNLQLNLYVSRQIKNKLPSWEELLDLLRENQLKLDEAIEKVKNTDIELRSQG